LKTHKLRPNCGTFGPLSYSKVYDPHKNIETLKIKIVESHDVKLSDLARILKFTLVRSLLDLKKFAETVSFWSPRTKSASSLFSLVQYIIKSAEVSPDNCTLESSIVRCQKNFKLVQNEEIITWDAKTANKSNLSLQINDSCPFNEIFTDLGQSRKLRTVHYNIEYKCPSPKSGCMIFYSYTINRQMKRILLVSNCHSSSDILSTKSEILSSIKDLHIFAIPEGIYPKSKGKGDPVEELIHEFFPKTFGPTLMQLFQFMDLAAISAELNRLKKLSKPIKPPAMSTHGFKSSDTNLIVLHPAMDGAVQENQEIQPAVRTDILENCSDQGLPLNWGIH